MGEQGVFVLVMLARVLLLMDTITMTVEQGFKTSKTEREQAALDFNTLRLPDAKFGRSTIPDLDKTKELADYMKAQFTQDVGSLVLAESIVDAHGWSISCSEYRLGSTLMALLIPMRTGGFTISINTRLNPSDERRAALIGHELGHVFFHDQSQTPPKRYPPDGFGKPEESFCDQFAYELTGYELRENGASEVVY